MEQQIISILQSHPRGITAREIANILNADRRVVNQILYGLQGRQCVIDSSYRWRLINHAQPVPTQGQVTAISADPILSNVCKYYLNCISLDNTNKISVFKDSKFTRDINIRS